MKSIYKENRPWGAFHILAEDENYKIKKIIVNPGKRMSYQFHNKRSECWIIIQGTAKINLNDKIELFKKGDIIEIPIKAKHRVENINDSDLIFIEVQTGEYFGEDDIVRIEDDFNRI